MFISCLVGSCIIFTQWLQASGLCVDLWQGIRYKDLAFRRFPICFGGIAWKDQAVLGLHVERKMPVRSGPVWFEQEREGRLVQFRQHPV